MNNLLDIITQNPIFNPLNDDQRHIIINQARRREYKKGEVIALHGDSWSYFIAVGEGGINAVKESREGRRLVVMTLDRGEMFWGPGFFDDDLLMPVTLEANNDCQIYLWDQESLLPTLLENGYSLWELNRLLITRMWQVSEIVEGLAFQPVAVRLARFIVDHFGAATQTPVTRDLTLDEMAAKVGTTREQVCRVLYRFSDEGLIKITRTEFVITDSDSLIELLDK